MRKVFRKFKSGVVYVAEFCRLPHIVVMLILMILSFFSIMASYFIRQCCPFISSILSNIFAGLVTGMAICMISGTKHLFNYKAKKKIDFLKKVHFVCKEFLSKYNEMIRKSADKNFQRKNFYNDIYDVLCKGNDIDDLISQGQFDKTISFNSYIFLKSS